MYKTVIGTFHRYEGKFTFISNDYSMSYHTDVFMINEDFNPCSVCFIDSEIVPERTACI